MLQVCDDSVVISSGICQHFELKKFMFVCSQFKRRWHLAQNLFLESDGGRALSRVQLAHILLKMLLHQRFPDYYPHKFLGDLFFASAEKNSALASSYSRFEWRLGVENEIRYRVLTNFLKLNLMSLIFIVFFWSTMNSNSRFVFFLENSSLVN